MLDPDTLDFIFIFVFLKDSSSRRHHQESLSGLTVRGMETLRKHGSIQAESIFKFRDFFDVGCLTGQAR